MAGHPIAALTLALSLAAAAGCDRLAQGTAPRLRVEPSRLSFGTIAVGEQDSAEVTLLNAGGGALRVSALTFGPDTSPAFGLRLARPLPWSLAPGASESFSVTFSPPGAGRHAGALEITSDDPEAPLTLLPIESHENAPRFAVEPPAVDFGLVAPGLTATADLALRNDGSAPLEVLAAIVRGHAALGARAQDYPARLLPSEVAALTLTFSPAACGAADAVLELASTDPAVPSVSVEVSGFTPGRSFTLTPRNGRLATTPVGGRSERRFVLRSRGTEPLALRAVSLAAEPAAPDGLADFSLGAAPAAASLPPEATAELTVTFAPTREGTRRAVLRIESDDCAGAVRELALTAEASPAGSGTRCALAFTPDALDFGAVRTGYVRDRETTLRATGTGPCVLAGVAFDAQGFSFASAPPVGTRLQPGDERTCIVRYAPDRDAVRAGRALVQATDPARGDLFVEAGVRVTGRSGRGVLEVTPTSHGFGLVRVGCASKEASFELRSAGVGDVTVRALTPTHPAVELRTMPLGPLLPGRSAALRTRLRPAAPGEIAAAVEIASDDDARPVQRVTLTGHALAGAEVVERFVQPLAPPADLLFVVDNSGSMLAEQAALERSFRTFAAAALAQRGDYQVGVVTTDTPYLRGVPAIVRATDPDPEGAFRRNVRVGNSGSGFERGLEMALRALTPPLSTTTNAGLLRPGVPLELVFVGDEDDQSPATIDAYLQGFARVVGAGGQFRVSAIVGPSPAGCASASGNAVPGTRFLDAAARTEGLSASICQADFGPTLAQLGEAVFGLRNAIPLRGTPDGTPAFRVRRYASTAACEADPSASGGTPVPESSWRYEAERNRIVLSPDAVPPRGACVQVAYTLECLSP